MILAIILSYVYRNDSGKDNVNQTEINSSDENMQESQNLSFLEYYLNLFKRAFNSFKTSPYFRYILLGLICLIVGGFVWSISKGKISFAKEQEKKAKIQEEKSYVEPIRSKTTYDVITKETTQKEVEKLFNSEKFKKMAEEKGENIENWNWQSREKTKRTIFREDKSDTSDEHMSQVDFSDND